LNNNQPILIYLLIFLALSIILKLFGIIDVENTELIGYAMIFYGINLVYLSFGGKQQGLLFTGTVFFLVGLLLFLINNFEFINNKEIIFPSILLILGTGFLMLFLDNTSKKNFLLVSLTFILSALIVTTLLGSITATLFVDSVVKITVKYWLIALVAIVLLIVLHRERKRSL
jgi:hypothetical protein